MLTKEELKRYQRQILLFGEAGQEKLKEAKVFIAGAGGLGSSVAIYLAVAGIGKITIADHDTVELSNLNRQILHRDSEIGKKKADSAREKLTRMNPNIEVVVTSPTIEPGNADKLVGDADLIVDAMDNFPTRYLLNKAALTRNVPLFFGAVNGFYGQTTTIIPGKTACLRCIFPAPPPSEVFPVVGATPGIIGCIQATEVIKYIVGLGSLLENRLLIWDGLQATADEVLLKKNLECEDCNQGKGIV